MLFQRQESGIRRAGFTLMELMMVLLIIAVALGLSVGVILTSKEGTGLKGAEQTLASLIRQARHTALSTGAPVQLLISKDDATITGVTQVMVASDNFERDLDGKNRAKGEQRRLSDSPTPLPGLSGYGWKAYHDTSKGLLPPRKIAFERKRQLMRRPGEGFYISCWVRPPLPKNDGDHRVQFYVSGSHALADWDDFGRTKGWLPLIMIGNNADPMTPGSSGGAFAGLCLELREMVIHSGGSGTVTAYHWVPVGWAGENVVANRVQLFTTKKTLPTGGSNPSKDVANPLAGEQWVQLGLLYDGKDLVIYKNEQEGNRITVGTLDPPPVPASSEIPQVHIGYVDTAATGPKASQAMIDSLRVLRLGADSPVKLPKGIVPEANYRIVADGATVQVYTESGGNWTQHSGPLTFRSNLDKKRWATVEIKGIGTITSKLHYDP